jgi:hypothetical protein
VYLWSDWLPFFSRVFYILLQRFVWIVSFSLLILVVSVSRNFIIDAVKGFKQMIEVMTFYGVKEMGLQLFIGIFVTVYMLLILSLGGGLASIANLGASTLPVFKNLEALSPAICLHYLMIIAAIGLPVLLIMTSIFVKINTKTRSNRTP